MYWNNLAYWDAHGLNGLANFGGNRFDEPLFVGGDRWRPETFRLTAASPYIRGGLPLSGLLPVGFAAVDFFGETFDEKNPPVDAVRYTGPGPERRTASTR